MAKEKQVAAQDDQADFVMSFVDHSRQERDVMEDIWEETEQNFLVRPWNSQGTASNTAWPLVGSGRYEIPRDSGAQSGHAMLKDPETHQEVMTIVSKTVVALFTEPGFIRARAVGHEDIFKAKVASELLQYAHRLPGHYLAMVEWILNAAIYGTGIMQAAWNLQEQPRILRSIEIDPITNEQIPIENTFVIPVYDDVRYSVRDIRDFFPDPGQTRTHSMLGAAVRFKITAAEARATEAYDQAAVELAIESQTGPRSGNSDELRDKLHDTPDELNAARETHADFEMLTGFEYFGRVPFDTEDEIDYRVITVIEGHTVRTDPWPRRLPFFECSLVPRPGSFYGIAPAEVIRHDQDFADCLKGMLADAVVRSTNPPPVYDKDMDVDLAKLRRYDPNTPIGIRGGPQSIGFVSYAPPVGPTFAMYSGLKQQMREATGAIDLIQGLGPAKSHTSATQFAGLREEALSRPELYAQLVEREWLPPLGRFTLNLYQEILDDDEDIRTRIGESNLAASLSDILPEFDIEYVGSRIEGNRSQKIQAFREIAQAAANPIILQLVPWVPLLQKWFNDLGAPEIAAMVGNPQLVEFHQALHQILIPQNQAASAAPQQGGGGAQNQIPAQAPTGLLDAQNFGELFTP